LLSYAQQGIKAAHTACAAFFCNQVEGFAFCLPLDNLFCFHSQNLGHYFLSLIVWKFIIKSPQNKKDYQLSAKQKPRTRVL